MLGGATNLIFVFDSEDLVFLYPARANFSFASFPNKYIFVVSNIKASISSSPSGDLIFHRVRSQFPLILEEDIILYFIRRGLVLACST
jgi:hypothetical protein